jgi:integrase
MIDGYFADPSIAKAEGTRRVYRAQKQRILARFGRRRVDEITRGELRSWYVEMVNETTISAANLASAAFGAFFKWAMWQDWITDSPATKLGRTKAKGRVVYITLQEELAFVAFCDANGFADVGDGLTLCVWTGASPVDACKLNLADLSADTWRFSRQKTGVEALPAFLPVVKARADRRRSQTVVGAHGAFLIDHLGKRHTPASLGRRFREARALAVVADVVPASFAHKRLQDARDTCVTRLADADVPFMKIWPWTGHSPKDAEAILRGHYLYLREEGAMETAAHLQAWAEKNRLPLA